MKAFGLQRKDTAFCTRKGTTRPCPCCLRVGPAEELVVERAGKKRQRFAARMEIASELLDMALDAEGVASAWEPHQKFRISHAWMQKRDAGFYAWDDYCRYDGYPYDDYRDYGSDRCYWCGGYDGCDCERCLSDSWYDPWSCYEDDRYVSKPQPEDPEWLVLWVDGKVETPYDWRDDEYEYESLEHCYSWSDDYDFAHYYGEEEFWWGNQGPVEAPAATEVLVAERAAEKLKAGDRYYRQNRRVAA